MFRNFQSLRKFRLLVRQTAAAQRLQARPLFSQSEGSRRRCRGNEENGRGGEQRDFDWSMRSLSSGVVVVGSTLGYWRCSSSFADNDSEDQVQEQPEFVPDNGSKFLFKDGYRRRVFFNYEKRIRMQSPPEKVFEYFASIKTPSGEVYMTPADLMRAVVPVFPPSESKRVREGFLRGERVVPGELQCAPSEFFMLFDTNNDGLISFPEYIFFVTLLSIPENSFTVAFKMFDLDNNGEIDKEEFKKVMGLMRSLNRQAARHRDGRRLGVKAGVENGGLLEYFFGKDGNSCLRHEKFVQFLRDLHTEILRLEFAHYDYNKKGSISAKDFALSLVAAADINHINKLLDRVDDLTNEPHANNMRISFEEFKAFAELRKKLQSFSLAIFSYGKVNGVLTKSDFQRAATRVCGVSITDNVADIIFHVFDTNRDGSLSADEFVRVLQRRENNSSSIGSRGMISCWMNCVSNCSSSKHFL